MMKSLETYDDDSTNLSNSEADINPGDVGRKIQIAREVQRRDSDSTSENDGETTTMKVCVRAPTAQQAADRKVISLVKARPLLYTRNNLPIAACYKRVNKLWQEVANAMGWKVSEVRRKWSHIRNSYSRHLRNEMHGACTGRGRVVSKWYLADEMEFLRRHMATDSRVMGKTKKSKEEILRVRRLAAQKRQQKVKNDRLLHQQQKDKNKERYERRKQEKNILPIREMTEKEKARMRYRNRKNSRAYYKRIMEKKRTETMKEEEILGGEETDSLVEDPLNFTSLPVITDTPRLLRSKVSKGLVLREQCVVQDTSRNVLKEEPFSSASTSIISMTIASELPVESISTARLSPVQSPGTDNFNVRRSFNGHGLYTPSAILELPKLSSPPLEEVDIKPVIQNTWTTAIPSPHTNHDSREGFMAEENTSYFQFFRGIYSEYQELSVTQQRLFQRECLSLLHRLLDDQDRPPLSMVSVEQEDPMNLSQTSDVEIDYSLSSDRLDS